MNLTLIHSWLLHVLGLGVWHCGPPCPHHGQLHQHGWQLFHDTSHQSTSSSSEIHPVTCFNPKDIHRKKKWSRWALKVLNRGIFWSSYTDKKLLFISSLRAFWNLPVNMGCLQGPVSWLISLMITLFKSFGSRWILGSSSAFIGYVRLYTHSFSSSCWPVTPCFDILDSSVSVFFWYSICTHQWPCWMGAC